LFLIITIIKVSKYDLNVVKPLINTLSPAIAKIFAQGLQRYNSPADWARKLFKPSTDSASLLVEIERKMFRFGFMVLRRRTSQVGVSFSFYWPSLGLVYAALDANPMRQLFRSSFFRN